MSITRRQAEDLLVENYGEWEDDDDWWEGMIDYLRSRYRSVRHLRREDPQWRIPGQWPGAIR